MGFKMYNLQFTIYNLKLVMKSKKNKIKQIKHLGGGGV